MKIYKKNGTYLYAQFDGEIVIVTKSDSDMKRIETIERFNLNIINYGWKLIEKNEEDKAMQYFAQKNKGEII